MDVIRYVGTGKNQRKIQVDFSMNQGKSWQHKELVAGQTFPVPTNCTTLLMDNIPYDPKGNYEIRDGNIVNELHS